MQPPGFAPGVLMRRFLRIVALLCLSFPLTAALAATVLFVPRERKGRWRAAFQGAWARAACALLGIRVEVVGDTTPEGNRLIVSNHLGYADILVLGGLLPASFVSKAEVARWPVIGPMASLAGTLYVDRESRCGARAFVERLRAGIASGTDVLVFPEGTSTRGEAILPFKPVPFAAVAGLSGMSVLPLHIDVVEIEGKPAVGPLRDLVCWHGDAPFAPHALRLFALRSVRFRVVVGRPIPCDGRDRGELARLSREQVAGLKEVSARRNRPLPGGFLWVHALP